MSSDDEKEQGNRMQDTCIKQKEGLQAKGRWQGWKGHYMEIERLAEGTSYRFLLGIKKNSDFIDYKKGKLPNSFPLMMVLLSKFYFQNINVLLHESV